MLPIESLTIHRFRGLRDLDLPKVGRFNVLVGRNNAGKSSVLEAVATYAHPLRPSEWVEVVRRREWAFSRAGLLEGLRWLFPQPSDTSRDPSEPFRGETKVCGTGRYSVRESVAAYSELEGFFDEDAGREMQGAILGPLAGSEAGTRRGARLELDATIEIQEAMPDLFGQRPRRVESFEIELWETSRGPIAQNAAGASLPVVTITPFSHRAQNVVEAFSEALYEDLRPMVLQLVRLFDPEIQDFEVLKRPRSEPSVHVRHSRLGRAPLSAFGDGMRRALLMGVSLATARGGVLLIDEIESAIHVEALGETFHWLQETCRHLDVQVFTTTHSLEAVDALLDAKSTAEDLMVYRLEQDAAGIRVKAFAPDRLRVLREELGQEIRS